MRGRGDNDQHFLGTRKEFISIDYQQLILGIPA